MKQKYLYGDYIVNIAERINHILAEISTEYNFDHGPEFEVAICDLLSEFLPERYGICRGFVIADNGEFHGDDIIIYDRQIFPTIRMLKRGRFDRKEKIPIESVYAYIEAKNTIGVDTYLKSIQQVVDVKTLCSKRETLAITQQDPYVVDQTALLVPGSDHYPQIRNPVFGMVWGKNCDGVEGAADPVDALLRNGLKDFPQTHLVPDLIVAGPNHYLSPTGVKSDGTNLPTQFFIPKITKGYQFIRRDGLAYASGLVQLLAALDFIRLGRLPWAKIINNSRFPI